MHYTNFTGINFANSNKKKKLGELPDKEFINRRSVLTDLFEISHVKTIFHIFVAILIVFSLNTIVYDIINEGRLNLDFQLMHWALGKFPKVMALWVCMQLSTLIVVYPCFYYWATTRRPGKVSWYDWIAFALFVGYQVGFLVLPLYYVMEHALPPASACIITTEQFLHLKVKIMTFIFTDDDTSTDDSLVPDFSKYLYFLFCPSLIYRDSYPRTPIIRWNYVVSNFAQVTACLFYTYYIFERFCVPVFRHFNEEHVTPKALLLSVFGSMLPGTMVLMIGFFAILHSWLNAFAEMLRFGDRMFYKLLGPKNRVGAMTMVFLISAIFHEYILIVSFGFFYPVLFVMFMGAGFGFIFLKGVSRSWNVFLWVALFIGCGLLMCLYSMEWYARQNCPVNSPHCRPQFMSYPHHELEPHCRPELISHPHHEHEHHCQSDGLKKHQYINI
ncbi:hypothetical protein KUTeg_008243 [Tegillarca granosa]|uniref:O-acyltransferase n=1 Tax=Tegillarca granosa TaxID=220873 RepID=A0ABQ9FBD7_TEGGR|nr:hypothetical protein KUTeg_008243 [Tegillarca granosa]